MFLLFQFPDGRFTDKDEKDEKASGHVEAADATKTHLQINCFKSDLDLENNIILFLL
jgi:hypothetical protein